MLGFVPADGRGGAEALLAALAARLDARGTRLAGAVQRTTRAGGGRPVMDLDVLGTGRTVRISLDLGPGATGCQLDPDGLARAVGLALAALEAGPQLVIVNKFGKVEAGGRGFRPVVAEALLRGIPVLTSVGPACRAAFHDFAGGLETELAPRPAALLAWLDQAPSDAAAAAIPAS